MAIKLRKYDVLLYQFEIYSDGIDIITLRIIVKPEDWTRPYYDLDLDDTIYNNPVIMEQLNETIKGGRTAEEMKDLPYKFYEVLVANNYPEGTVFIFKTHDEILKRNSK